jgi:hypothetical protein
MRDRLLAPLKCLLYVIPLLHTMAVGQLQYYVGIVTQEAVVISGVPDGARIH